MTTHDRPTELPGPVPATVPFDLDAHLAQARLELRPWTTARTRCARRLRD